jgi:cytidine deaminase
MTLIEAALAVRNNAYAPYSKFYVGAAEQVAITKAVSEGAREFVRIAISSQTSPPAGPCGICRQTLAEFCEDIEIILVNPKGETSTVYLSGLLPHAFRPSDLQGAGRDA